MMPGLWRLQREALPGATVVLDWWHAAMRFEHALQAARGLGAGTADTHFADEAVRGLERAKWRLWHGRWPGCRHKLAALCRWTERKRLRDLAGIGRLQQRASELLGYLEHNQAALVHYAARRRRGEPISTAFVESAVNEIVAKRMNKKQQMRWSRTTVQPFLDVRTAVLNDTLEDAFRYRHREHSKSWGADGIGLGFGLTGRGWAGAEAGMAGEADCGAASWGDNGNRACPH
jgi:hypothetical protein